MKIIYLELIFANNLSFHPVKFTIGKEWLKASLNHNKKYDSIEAKIRESSIFTTRLLLNSKLSLQILNKKIGKVNFIGKKRSQKIGTRYDIITFYMLE